MQGVLHKRFQQRKIPAESNQPALRAGRSTADYAALTWPAPFQMEQPTWFLLIAGVHAYYEKMLGKSCVVLFSAVLLSFSRIFPVLKTFPLRAQGKKFNYCCLRRAQEQVHSPNTPSLLLTVDTISPSALGLWGSPHVTSIWKEDAPLVRGRPAAPHFCSTMICLQFFQQWRSGLGWRTLQISLL